MIKKILVAGSSIAAGSGFPQGINDPDTWPNQLKKKLCCELDNVSSTGYDCAGIFFLATKKLFIEHYDLILIEIPPLNRVIVRPNVHGSLDVSGRYRYDDIPAWHEWFEKHLLISKKDWNILNRVMVAINTDFEHWKKFIGVITTAQILIQNNYNIKFINNSVNWNRDFFSSKCSDFAKNIFCTDYLSDEDLEIGLDIIEQDKKLIELKHWINPYDSLIKLQTDRTPSDNHPGRNSNCNTSNMIIDYISNQ